MSTKTPKPEPAIKLSSIQLAQLLEKQRRREELEKEIEKLSDDMRQIAAGRPLNPPRPEPGHQRSPKGSVKDSIVQAIRGSGRTGIHVQDIEQVTGLSRQRIERFLYSSTGKGVEGLQKVRKAVFRIVG